MKQTLLSRSIKQMLGEHTLQVKLDPQAIYWISMILARFQNMCLAPIDRHALSMDLTFVHSNGCPLDFQRFATHQNDVEFALTVTQIQKLVDRSTGKLRNGFVPMFALKGN